MFILLNIFTEERRMPFVTMKLAELSLPLMEMHIATQGSSSLDSLLSSSCFPSDTIPLGSSNIY